MRLLSFLIPAVLATLAICQPIEDLVQLEIQRRDCEGSEVENPACRREVFQVCPFLFHLGPLEAEPQIDRPGPIQLMCLR